MNVYTLNESFVRQDIVEGFKSIIWTERYTKAGDFSLEVAATPEMMNKMVNASYIALDDTQEVMMVESRLIKNGILTVTGNSLLSFLNHRIVKTSHKNGDQSWFLFGMPPGETIAEIVQSMCIAGPILDGTVYVGIDSPWWETIDNMFIDAADSSGDDISVAVPFGPLYTAINSIAEAYSVGIKLYLDRIDPVTGRVLEFQSYKGVDRTSTQTEHPVVRFSPKLDSLTEIEELWSGAAYKNICYAVASNISDTEFTPMAMALAPGYAPGPMDHPGFAHRTLMISVDDLATSPPDDWPEDLNAWIAEVIEPALVQRAKDALAKNNYIQLVDGHVILRGYKYGVDFGLGDIVELEGLTGILQKARITEYIRTIDDTGEKEYPTVTVLD